MRAFRRTNGLELRTFRIIEFLLSVRENLRQGVRKPIAIELASNQVDTDYKTGQRIWDNRYVWLKKGR